MSRTTISILVGAALFGAQAVAMAQSAAAPAKPASASASKAAAKQQSTAARSANRNTASKASQPRGKASTRAKAPAKGTVPAAGAAAAGAAAGAAVAAPAVTAPPPNDAEINPHSFRLVAGTYDCDLDRKVQVRQVAQDYRSAVLHWGKRDYAMQAVPARTGALRYEDAASGLVWIVIASKSMLLDTKQGLQLANDCKSPDMVSALPSLMARAE